MNAFLRAFDADKVRLPQDALAALSLKLSYPAFALKRLIAEYGEETAEKIASAAAEA